MEHHCPHCGAELPEDAAFCPHCARAVQARRRAHAPSPLLRPLLLGAALLAVLAAVFWYVSRPPAPQEYEGSGEVYYETGGKTYQLLVAWPDDRVTPAAHVYQDGAPEEQYRWPSRWYVNDTVTGGDAWAEFEPLVESVTVEAVPDDDAGGGLAATEPTHHDYSPDAAMVSFLDFTGSSGEPHIFWTIRMKNGDLIRVRQDLHITPKITHVYHWEEEPMSTIEELQALVDRINEEIPVDELVKLYLPAVTYEGALNLTGHSLEFYGCTDGTGRTVFDGTLHATESPDLNYISYFYDLDFVGTGDEVGLSLGLDGWAIGCTFTGYKTGVLAYGEGWVNLTECTFTDNQVGFHFNSTGRSASSVRYFDNIFTGNDTALLLESIPTDLTICFDGTRFEDNGTDIDNRCGPRVDTTKAIFA